MRPLHLGLLTAIILTTHATPASSRTWYILSDGTGDAPTIQAGVDSASAGDIVLVAAGTYSSMSSVVVDGTPTAVCVAITKNIRLLSEDGPANTTIGNVGAGVVIYLHAVDSSAEVNGFTIQSEYGGFACVGPIASSPPPGWTFGIKCQASTPRIVGNHITDNASGIELNASPALVSGNTITDADTGVECKAGSDANITNNIISMCGSSILSQASAPQIVGNDLSNGCVPVVASMSSLVIRENLIHGFESSGIAGGPQLVIEGNTFFDFFATSCIQLSGLSVSAAIRGNVFYNVAGVVRLLGTGAVTIENNTIDGAGGVISCEFASPTIRNNIIVHSGRALYCFSSNPTIECNDIFDVDRPFEGGCTDQTGINGNIAVDPQFCGIPGGHNYTLQGDSPCVAGNHPDGVACGQIGALGVECGTVPTKSATWGSVKSLYGKKR